MIKKQKYKDTAFPYNTDLDRKCYCVIVPFKYPDEEEAFRACVEQNTNKHFWAVDTMIIEETDFKKLKKKSDRLQLLEGLKDKKDNNRDDEDEN